MNLHHHQYKKRVPAVVANVLADRRSGDISVDCEKILKDSLVSIRALLFRYHASTMSHDMSSVMDHVNLRALEATEEDLAALVARLNSRHQGTYSMHKATAYSQMTRQLVSDLEAAIFDQNKERVDVLQQEKLIQQSESIRVHNMLGRDLALKEQELSRALSEKLDLESRMKAVLRQNESLKNELEKTLRDQTQTHQLAVELRLHTS